jgi:hypothetical protein
VIALVLCLSGTASAATRFVEKTGSSDSGDCADAANPCATIMYAVGQAANGDTIQIGPGAFTEEVNTDKPLTFVGAGAGHLPGPPAATVILGPAGTNSAGHPAMSLPSGVTVRALRAQGGSGANSLAQFGEPGATGIVFPSDIPAPVSLSLEEAVVVGGDGGFGTQYQGGGGDGVTVTSGPGPVALSATGSEFAGGEGLGPGEGIWVRGSSASAELMGSRIVNEANFGDGLTVYGGGRVSVVSSEVAAYGLAATIYDGSLAIDHSRLTSEGSALYVSGSNEESPEATVVDSLLLARKAEALYVTTEENGSASVSVGGSTLVGHGLYAAYATRGEGAGPAAITLRNSVVRNIAPSGLPFPTYDLLANGGTISADFSSFSTRAEENGGSVTAPGSGSNVAGDPGFLDEQHDVFVLSSGSPLIDRGDAGVVQGGETDLLGNPRSLDGNRDCVAAPDIGAFELTGQEAPCDPPPVLSGVGITNRVFAPAGGGKRKGRRAAALASKRGVKRVKRGTRFTYRLSEPAEVSITIERRLRGRKVRRAGTTRCVKARPGRAKPRCFRFIRTAALNAGEQAGRQFTFFSGRSRGRPLKPGRYRARLRAVDSAGQKSQTRQVSFRIVRGS